VVAVDPHPATHDHRTVVVHRDPPDDPGPLADLRTRPQLPARVEPLGDPGARPGWRAHVVAEAARQPGERPRTAHLQGHGRCPLWLVVTASRHRVDLLARFNYWVT